MIAGHAILSRLCVCPSVPSLSVCLSVRSPAPKSGAGGWVGSGLVLLSDLAGADASPCTYVTSDFVTISILSLLTFPSSALGTLVTEACSVLRLLLREDVQDTRTYR